MLKLFFKKRILLGILSVTAFAIIAIASPLLAATPTSVDKPNILVIFGDDIGWMNVSSFGGDIMGVQTPNIDRIGKEGLRLTSFYAQPSCTAGRAAFITGQLPVRTGLTTVGTPGSPFGLKSDDITLAEILKTKGYATAQYGKNHLGDLDEHLPCRHGFDEYFGNLYHLNANEDLEDPDRPQNPEFRQKFDPKGVVSCTAGGPAKDEGQLTVARMKGFDGEIAAKSLDYLDRRAKDGKPFFLWHNSTRQHVFIHLKPEAEKQSRAGREDIYGDGLKEHDGQVGQLLAKLDQTGLDKNTIVIYTTDNGAYQYMWPEGGTSPFRGDKGTTWEGGVRVPFVLNWPAQLKSAEYHQPVIQLDLRPTILASVGSPVAADEKLDGVNLLPYAKGEATGAPHESLYWRFGEQTAIRHGDWKLVKANGIDKPGLFNLKDDIGEQNDKSASEPEVFAKLQKTWDEWNATLVEPTWKPAAQQGGKGNGKGKGKKKNQ